MRHKLMADQDYQLMEGKQQLGTSMVSYCHLLNGYIATWRSLEDDKEGYSGVEKFGRRGLEGDNRFSSVDLERESECGICLEPCTKIVLPNYCHAMCIKCYRNWNTKSESCPFGRGSLKRVNSEDVWVLTCDNDVVDTNNF